MPDFIFEVTLKGTGETQEEAWRDATEAFSMDPGEPASFTQEDDDPGLMIRDSNTSLSSRLPKLQLQFTSNKKRGQG